ncbi:unnamed protein product [Orchesella dallaii]|uniref:CRAL/TRIO N-terminal domain-containing protein n=1 Tax=Orchesella dallaii TaxID=48710 RepID=A0ABP1SAN7_9HEXA
MDKIFIKYVLFSITVLTFFDKQVNISAISVQQFLSLSFQEKTALDQFRAKVEPILENNCMRHDTYLIRWLRARNFDINAADRMLRENLRWRKENKIDNIKYEDFKDMESDYPYTIDTYDKIGQPIGALDISEWDLRRAVLEGKSSRYNRYTVALVENITGQVCERQRKGMNVTQVVVLLYADGLNVVQQVCPICIPLWIQFVTVMENYYAEWIDEFIVIDGEEKMLHK